MILSVYQHIFKDKKEEKKDQENSNPKYFKALIH